MRIARINSGKFIARLIGIGCKLVPAPESPTSTFPRKNDIYVFWRAYFLSTLDCRDGPALRGENLSDDIIGDFLVIVRVPYLGIRTHLDELERDRARLGSVRGLQLDPRPPEFRIRTLFEKIRYNQLRKALETAIPPQMRWSTWW